jgi:hypothetical protein
MLGAPRIRRPHRKFFVETALAQLVKVSLKLLQHFAGVLNCPLPLGQELDSFYKSLYLLYAEGTWRRANLGMAEIPLSLESSLTVRDGVVTLWVLLKLH